MTNLLLVTPIFPPRTGGPATYVWELAHRLKKKYKLTIICFSDQPKPIKGVTIIAISESGTPISRQLKLFAEVFARSAKADLAYIQGPLVVGLASTLAAKLTGTKTILKFVGDEVWEDARLKGKTNLDLTTFYKKGQSLKGSSLFDQLKVFAQSISFAFADFIITPSNFLKDFLATAHRLNRQKIFVINNAVSATNKKPKKAPYSLIFVGRLVPWKNLDQIIHATSLAHQTMPWTLTIIGEGPGEDKLRQLIRLKQAQSWIFFLGRLSHQQTRECIARSTKLILYSDYEGLPHVLIEAMLSKTTIVASDIAANRETTNGLAQLVVLNDPQALAQAINKPFNKLEKARRFAQKTYTWNNHIDQLTKLL